MNLQARFDLWTRMINLNPGGFRQSRTGKHRLARGQSLSPYEQMAAQVYGEPVDPETSARGDKRREAQAEAKARVSELRGDKYLNSSPRKRRAF